jgi:hypothetical protein
MFLSSPVHVEQRGASSCRPSIDLCSLPRSRKDSRLSVLHPRGASDRNRRLQRGAEQAPHMLVSSHRTEEHAKSAMWGSAMRVLVCKIRFSSMHQRIWFGSEYRGCIYVQRLPVNNDIHSSALGRIYMRSFIQAVYTGRLLVSLSQQSTKFAKHIRRIAI